MMKSVWASPQSQTGCNSMEMNSEFPFSNEGADENTWREFLNSLPDNMFPPEGATTPAVDASAEIPGIINPPFAIPESLTGDERDKYIFLCCYLWADMIKYNIAKQLFDTLQPLQAQYKKNVLESYGAMMASLKKVKQQYNAKE